MIHPKRFLIGASVLALVCGAGSALAQTSVTVIGPLTGSPFASGTAYAVSNDGSLAVGSIQNSLGQLEAFRWTPSGTVGLGMLGTSIFPQSHAVGFSADGATIIGYGFVGNGPSARAFRWSQAGGMVNMGLLPGAASGSSYAKGISADGAVIVGESSDGNNRERAFIWTNAGGMQALGDLPSSRSTANGISKDGRYIVGQNNVTRSGINAGTYHAYIFDRNTSTSTYLAPLAQNRSANAMAVSDDGSVLAGSAALNGTTWRAVRWQGTAAPVDLGTLGGSSAFGMDQSFGQGISGDGSIVVGTTFNTANKHEGFRWTQATGMKGVTQLLTDAGVSMTGQRIYNIAGISQNGQYMAGERVTVGLSGDGAPEPVVIRYMGSTGTGTGGTGTGTGGTGTGTGGTGTGTGTGGTGTGTGGTGTGTGGTGTGTGGTGNGTGGTGGTGTGTGGTGTGSIGGVTTLTSVTHSVGSVGRTRQTAAIQQAGFAAAMMGASHATSVGTSIGSHAAVGSVSGGATGSLSFGNGFALLGGVGGMTERYRGVRVGPSMSFGAALRYVSPVAFGGVRPYLEGGGWHMPDVDYRFRRVYANGAGTALGTGKTSGQQTYVYSRLGVVIGSVEATEWTGSAEIGRMVTRVGGYAEALSPTNPFDATFARSTDTMTIGKVRLAVTHRFTEVIDGTVWIAGARAFDQNIGTVATVSGFGAIRPAVSRASWLEYGVRAGAKISSHLSVDVFANGVASTRSHSIHAGAGIRYGF